MLTLQKDRVILECITPLYKEKKLSLPHFTPHAICVEQAATPVVTVEEFFFFSSFYRQKKYVLEKSIIIIALLSM